MLTAADIQELLRYEKTSQALTDAELAAKYGVVQSYMSKLLSGASPPGDKILRRLGLRRIVRYVANEAEL